MPIRKVSASISPNWPTASARAAQSHSASSAATLAAIQPKP